MPLFVEDCSKTCCCSSLKRVLLFVSFNLWVHIQHRDINYFVFVAYSWHTPRYICLHVHVCVSTFTIWFYLPSTYLIKEVLDWWFLIGSYFIFSENQQHEWTESEQSSFGGLVLVDWFCLFGTCKLDLCLTVHHQCR